MYQYNSRFDLDNTAFKDIKDGIAKAESLAHTIGYIDALEDCLMDVVPDENVVVVKYMRERIRRAKAQCPEVKALYE